MATDLHQSSFSLVGYPFSLKFIIAPIIDAFYTKRIGRRESWILPLQLVCTIILGVLSADITMMLEASPPEVARLTTAIFVLVAATAAGDIATDAWAAGRMSDSRASVCQAVGLTIGAEGSSTVFFLLMGKGLIDIQMLFQIMSSIGVGILSCFLALLLQRSGRSKGKDSADSDSTDEEDVAGIVEVISRSFALLRKSSNLRWWLAYIMLIPMLSGHSSVMAVRYQAIGFSPELFAEYDLYLLPVSLLVMWLAGKLAQTRHILKVHSWMWLLLGVVQVASLLHLRAAQDLGEASTKSTSLKGAYILLSQLGRYLGTMLFVLNVTFHNRLAQKHEAIAGSVITFLASISNLGGLLPATWAPLMAAAFGLEVTVISCLVTGAVVLAGFWQKLRLMENPDDDGW
eukprot:TRINITY_DN16175_c0_g1_i4.p1 TRINITY_DN16175_c0_g1~~TRINITY_DN16175_c0_g1_i4.p1  ORF type:complete len:456 (+),score=71.40 TRINITY_DN16175_c0_g1_i4:168-1370(+)